ncbi:uncharacterized protein LOC111680773 [Lucilia cuprina]|uniref:uncharacterized protein LOC111680773 n=1 Tax=Lucilia cuprina TaxID=7375 RepID=UPI001F05DE8C|nr:uncharacterized protein LOC111680773 [Lucilia cuprina]XP_046812362.1 uncharacterized protein LOC111680773 [Lucilia cuprina]XP_046812363.1 uncharacterized protein LOC111680773 [Lucilia cuprina]XP_046812364.1 uncharacterized protein LOC111680773 [Lucilia cuprina]XP_046812365.1 uncharacterized protein LOC111680773 [Lucilia cuprina]
MSFSQSLVIQQHDYEIFGPSWQAGVSSSQSLAKSLRSYDVESVNIGKTCEKLCSVLSAKRDSKQELSQDVEDDDNLCAVKNTDTIPFRAFTNIWYGTLKIYQQQVNTLFRLSQDLLSRSCNYDVKHLEATKRKSSLKSQKCIKKRRLTLRESTDKSFISTNYSELLEDLERLTQEPIQKALEQSSQTVSRSTTQLQIREITIREISATTTHSIDEALDEDSGFGEATHDEIAEFLNLFNDNSILNVKKTPTKRKSTCEHEIPIKQDRYSNDSTIELPKENIIITKNPVKTSPLKRSFTPIEFAETFKKHKYLEDNDTPENVPQNIFVQNNEFIDPDGIKISTEVIVKNKQIAKRCGVKSKKMRLIIDECTKIDTSEFIEEMKSKNTFSAKLARKKIFKSYKTKKIRTALELLTRFNRRSLKLCLTLKQKINLSREQFEREYLNLLREIFTTNFNEKWASEIYPKWLYFKDAPEKSNKSTPLKKLQIKRNSVQQPVADLNNPNEHLNADAVIDDNNNDVYNINQEIQKLENNFNKEPACANQHMWHPYGVMLNLLNMWRFNQTNEIAAKTLFKLAENRFDTALGFYSLLDLSKNQFVYLTRFPETIALRSILMGKSIKK